jgi:hypothetical protein
MIECEKCKCYSHTKCYDIKKNEIPNIFVCDFCKESNKETDNKNNKNENYEIKEKNVENIKSEPEELKNKKILNLNRKN